MDAFKAQPTVKLDFLHAFGAYTGNTFHDVFGQVNLIEDASVSVKDNKHNDSQVDPLAEGSHASGGTNGDKKKVVNKNENFFNKLKLVYPVGRHLAFRSLGTNLMKFVKLPSDIKDITSICFNHTKTMMAIAVRNNEITGHEKLNITIYFYSMGASSLNSQNAKHAADKKAGKQVVYEVRREKILTIRLTHSGNIPLSEFKLKDAKKAQIDAMEQAVTVDLGGHQKAIYYNRYISNMSFSHDEKYISMILRNGENDYQVVSYDFLDRKPRKVFIEKFSSVVVSCDFSPRDSSKMLLVGENSF